MSRLKNYAVSILIPLGLGAIVGFLISGSMDYANLVQPPLSPPSWLFPVVWTILYVLMGVSYGILSEKSLVDDNTRLLYYGQLFVNLLWPVAFVVWRWRLFAFIWIVLLDVLVLRMVIKFYRKDETAGLLQIPYALWVLFASYLNLGVFILNG